MAMPERGRSGIRGRHCDKMQKTQAALRSQVQARMSQLESCERGAWLRQTSWMSIHSQVAEETWKQWEIAGQCCKESNTFVSWSTSLMFQNSEVVLHHIAGEVHLIILKLRNCMYINIGDIEKKNDHVEREKEWVDRLSLEEKIRSCKFCTCYNYMWRSKALKVSQVRNN